MLQEVNIGRDFCNVRSGIRCECMELQEAGLIHFFKRYEGEDVFSVDVVFIRILLLQNTCGP